MDTGVLVSHPMGGNTGQGRRGQTDSVGSMLPMSARDSVIGHIPPMQTAAGVAGVAPAMFLSREDLSTLTEEDKVSTNSSGHGEVVEHAPPTAYYTYRRASGSMPSVPQSVVGIGGSSGSLTRAHTSLSSHDRTITLDPAASPHASLQSSVRGHMSHQSHPSQQSQSSLAFAGEAPLAGRLQASPMSAEMFPVNRSSSSGQRRAAVRKPVPAYVPTDAEPGSYSTMSSMDSPLYQAGLDDSPAASSSNLHGTLGEELRLPELNHKSSFGDMRPVHILMPDRPSAGQS